MMDAGDWARIGVNLDGPGRLEVGTPLLHVCYSQRTFADGAVSHVITGFGPPRPDGNLVGDQIDGTWYGYGDGPTRLTNAAVVTLKPDFLTIRAEWDNGRVERLITAFRDRPILRIDYLSYGINVVDLTRAHVLSVEGEEDWQEARREAAARRPELLDIENPHHRLTTGLHPAYPNPLTAASDWGGLEPEALDRNGYVVMSWHDPERALGYARLVSIVAASYVKLLRGGCEVFPFWKRARQPFHCYLLAGQGAAFALRVACLAGPAWWVTSSWLCGRGRGGLGS